MDEKLYEVLILLDNIIDDNKRAYKETGNDYFFGRLCASEEIYKKILNMNK